MSGVLRTDFLDYRRRAGQACNDIATGDGMAGGFSQRALHYLASEANLPREAPGGAG
jgi:hypothetical protein